MSDELAAATAALAPIDPKVLEKTKADIAAAFALFDKDGKGTVLQDEVPTLIRSLGAYPTEKDIIRNIIPEMQEEEPVDFVTYARFEKKMLGILLPNNGE